MVTKPGFDSNVTAVIKKQTKTFDETTHNPKYAASTLYNGEAWMYSVNDWLVENGVPIAKESLQIFIPTVDSDIDESCHITVDGTEYRIVDAGTKRDQAGNNHMELRLERRKV
jgi:hypothetical protein